ncbi:hypothetical protein [Maribacter sp. 4U21]|uniref:hypothetical protein n=1 Tax=Maribacter sp. 4U21 TaxID=1889779 RepID=UPI000C1458DC|nr:hypothetical protein [Maribacter sp. 4U21]
MKKTLTLVLIPIFLFLTWSIAAKVQQSELFKSKSIFPLKLEYSNKQIKKHTDKENAVYTDIIYGINGTWDTIPVSIRARGNFRRANCYFPPLKIYLKKSLVQGSLFQGHKQLKLVLPCLLENRSNDDIVKEYLAYKIYEELSEIHFKTRLVSIEYIDNRDKKLELHPLTSFLPQKKLEELYNYKGEEAFAFRKPKTYKLMSILIEDDKVVAKRNNAKLMKRFVHPLNQGEIASITNSFFQFMIGNTDFSTAYQHNQKLLFKNLKTIPLPYDFDMSGLVDASYAVVSNVQNNQLDISKVTERKYRGFKRDPKLFQKARKFFLKKKPAIMQLLDKHQQYFEDKKEFQKTRNYIQGFYIILEHDSKFEKTIIQEARVK